ncbi:hypothetical protein EDD18DRAFT_1316800 [Armillaria luteobubalina]|uniref:Protein kinase domain-containing protein n=1 Tax=Armillaria luteobubalina TaxID=153913 RepID=A0AA39TZA6_9AGAR|nr:hypothetical protein EDD18DRAFT_1316800 [Armillaria luteobubalina]
MSGKDLGPPNISFMKCEAWWRQYQHFLHTSGYQLRAKFEPSWKPPWKINYEMFKSEERALHSASNLNSFAFSSYVMDAIRVHDGRRVTLKRVSKSRFPLEVELSVFLSSSPLSVDPRNHCVPIHDVLQSPHDPDHQIIVMPFLRKFFQPTFDTIGELLEPFRQILEGVEFLHRHFIAHRQLYPKGFHPAKPRMNETFTGSTKHITPTECWPRHLTIDFGVSRRYSPPDIPYEPVSNCGNRYHKYSLLQFLVLLVDAMIQKEPSVRPTISEVVHRFAVLCNSIFYTLIQGVAQIDQKWEILRSTD